MNTIVKQIYLVGGKASKSRNSYLLCRRCQYYGTMEEIKIPKYIKRSPTSLLQAIASLVNVDTTGPAYKYHDDPFLTPLSNMEKRKYALAKESGRKAAQFIRDTLPECFDHQPDDPIIKNIIPKVKYEDKDINEATLISSIENIQVTEAIKIYRDCQSKNVELSRNTLQALLELVSYFNAEDTIDPYWQEEYSAQSPFKDTRLIKTWKDMGIAEEIFEQIKDSGAKPYYAIIRGMCTYFQTDRAWQLYQEALENNIPLDTGTYNALFKVCLVQREDAAERWDLMKSLLEKMAEEKLKPNVMTLNSVLECLSYFKSWKKAPPVSLSLVKEFQRLHIEPSLATYFHLIRIHQFHRNVTSPVLPSILDQIERKSFVIQDLKDTLFFFSAMEACKSWELAERVHRMLLIGDNNMFLKGTLGENIYYRNYLIQAAQSLPLPEFMKMYDKIVPFVFSPDSEVMEEILKLFGVCDNLEELPRIWSDVMYLGHANNETLIELTLMIMNKHSLETVEPLQAARLVNVAWDIWESVQKDKQNDRVRTKIEWTGHMLGDCISTLIRCGASDKAFHIMQNASDEPSLMVGHLPIETLQLLLNDSIERGNSEESLVVIQYAKACGYTEDIDMAKRLAKQENLSDDMKNKLVYSYGPEIL